MNKQIDIIIPAFNAHATLSKALASILTQKESANIAVYIIDDCSSESYRDILTAFRPFLDITLFRLSENCGPGVARQFGIEQSSSPFVMFVDADDTLGDCFAVSKLLQTMKNETIVATYGHFIEETPQGTLLEHSNDTVWCFANMYRRSYLQKHSIRFTQTRSNEDAGFNMQVKLCSSTSEQIQFINDITYIWHNRSDSITRSNNCEYTYNASILGYAENMIDAFTHCRQHSHSEFYRANILDVLTKMYRFYIETLERKPQNIGICLKASQDFYREIYLPIASTVKQEELDGFVINTLRDMVKSPCNEKIVFCPRITFKNWLTLL